MKAEKLEIGMELISVLGNTEMVKSIEGEMVYCFSGKKIRFNMLKHWEPKIKSDFASERSRTLENSTRYGKDILNNFDIEKDLVVWDIKNKYDQMVTFEHPEIIGSCPVSGYPDTYVAKFSFVTDKLTMELKAFKLWLNSYYNKQVSHEYLAQEIFTIFWEKVQPKYLRVTLKPAPRGNITTTVVCEKCKEGDISEYRSLL